MKTLSLHPLYGAVVFSRGWDFVVNGKWNRRKWNFWSTFRVLKRMCLVQEDPELKPMFEEMQKGGMDAMMKYMNDPKWLAKVGEKLGDPAAMAAAAGGGGAGPAAASRPPPAPQEITNIIQAAKSVSPLSLCAMRPFVITDFSEMEGAKSVSPLVSCRSWKHCWSDAALCSHILFREESEKCLFMQSSGMSSTALFLGHPVWSSASLLWEGSRGLSLISEWWFSCRFGDLEAVEDFLAVGKNVNEVKYVYHSIPPHTPLTLTVCPSLSDLQS